MMEGGRLRCAGGTLAAFGTLVAFREGLRFRVRGYLKAPRKEESTRPLRYPSREKILGAHVLGSGAANNQLRCKTI